MEAASQAPDPVASEQRTHPTGLEMSEPAGFRPTDVRQQNLTLVRSHLVLADPDETPNAAWHEALAQLACWLDLGIQRVPRDRPQGLRQRAKWAWGRAAPEAPVFAPWLPQTSRAFQDPRVARELFPTRWVASYLWDPCGSFRGRSAAIDVMLISAHPAACRMDEESCVSLPGIQLLQEMISAAHAEGRSRVAVIGYERSRSTTARQLLAAKPRLPGAAMDLEVLAIEEALTRLAGNPAHWDAIIVLPELRSLVFALLAEMSGIRGPWPMLWHSQRLALVCGETAGLSPANGPIDAALLVQALALTLRAGGNAFAARRLSEGWARLRDRGLVTPSRGATAPYVTQVTDADLLACLCEAPPNSGRPVAEWKAMLAPTAEPVPASAPARHGAARLELVRER